MGTIGPETSSEVTYQNHQGRPCRFKFVTQKKYRSKPRDFSRPLPYDRRITAITSTPPEKLTYSWVDCLNFGAGVYYPYKSASALKRCHQKAYGELIGSVKELQQGWGESLATRKQAFDMMLHRVGTLIRAVRLLKRGDIPGFLKALGATPRKRKSKLMTLSDTWLEYHFGWEPLYGDIYAACKMLSEFKLPYATVKGRGVEHVHLHEFGPFVRTSYTGKVVVKLQGDYYVDNPNKFLFNQAGIINPLSIAWELVPFSFVVDWFIPIGQYLGGLTDFFGVHRQNEFTTRAAFITSTMTVDYGSAGWLGYNSSAVDVHRTLGIQVPKPVFKLIDRFSPVRGATAIALLVGMLRSLEDQPIPRRRT